MTFRVSPPRRSLTPARMSSSGISIHAVSGENWKARPVRPPDQCIHNRTPQCTKGENHPRIRPPPHHPPCVDGVNKGFSLPPSLPPRGGSVCTRLAMHFDNDVWQAGGAIPFRRKRRKYGRTTYVHDAQYSTRDHQLLRFFHSRRYSSKRSSVDRL